MSRQSIVAPGAFFVPGPSPLESDDGSATTSSSLDDGSTEISRSFVLEAEVAPDVDKIVAEALSRQQQRQWNEAVVAATVEPIGWDTHRADPSYSADSSDAKVPRWASFLAFSRLPHFPPHVEERFAMEHAKLAKKKLYHVRGEKDSSPVEVR